jgi:hypothetical protein
MAGSLQRAFAPTGPFPYERVWEKEAHFLVDHLVCTHSLTADAKELCVGSHQCIRAPL